MKAKFLRARDIIDIADRLKRIWNNKNNNKQKIIIRAELNPLRQVYRDKRALRFY